MKTQWLLMVGVAVLASCAREPERARHTVEEYRADATLRHEQVERCKADPGTLRKTPDCINAQTAAAFEDRVRLRDAPPVGLDTGHNATSQN